MDNKKKKEKEKREDKRRRHKERTENDRVIGYLYEDWKELSRRIG